MHSYSMVNDTTAIVAAYETTTPKSCMESMARGIWRAARATPDYRECSVEADASEAVDGIWQVASEDECFEGDGDTTALCFDEDAMSASDDVLQHMEGNGYSAVAITADLTSIAGSDAECEVEWSMESMARGIWYPAGAVAHV